MLLQVEDLSVCYPVFKGALLKSKRAEIRAVEQVSFHISAGETLGLVGESGCGKTSVGRSVLRLEEPAGGRVIFAGEDLGALDKHQLRQLRRQMQIVFQDPFSSLDPRMTAREVVGEPLRIHGLFTTRQEYRDRTDHLLEMVGLNPGMAERYPHEFSGGQRQRIGIARALSVSPRFIVCDEPVSALDVSIQAQIINLLETLQERLQLTYLFIAHDLAVVRHISDRVAVMYLGRIVEIAGRNALYRSPLHPYTQALLAAVPIPDPVLEAGRKHLVIEGEISDSLNLPMGCRFHPRCPKVEERCREEVPGMRPATERKHWVACHSAG